MGCCSKVSSRKLLALLLCFVCLAAALPGFAIAEAGAAQTEATVTVKPTENATTEPETAAPAKAGESAPAEKPEAGAPTEAPKPAEQPEKGAVPAGESIVPAGEQEDAGQTGESNMPAGEQGDAEQTGESNVPAGEQKDAEQPEETNEPAEEPKENEETEDDAEKSDADKLYERLMAYETLDELNAALEALTEEEQALLDQFTEEQNAALEAKISALGGYGVATLETREKSASFTQGQGGTADITVSGNLRTSNKFSSSCTQAGITAARKDSNSYTVTVDASVPAGIYTLTVTYETESWSGYPNWSWITTEYTDTVTITVTEAGSEYAQVFYLKTPTSDPDSNATNQWGECVGNGTVKISGDVTWKQVDGVDKNLFSPGAYVVGMPTGFVKQADGSWLMPKANYSAHYTAIFDAYRAELQESLGVTINSVDDIEAIYLIPYKISQNNGSTPDKHIDCMISVKTNNFFAAVFWVTMPDGTVKQADAKNYQTGSKILKTDKAPTDDSGDYPQTITVNGVTYRFDGWYNEAGEKVADDSWAYEPSTKELEDGIVQFYANYVKADAKLTVRKTLSGNMYNENDKFAFTVTYGNGDNDKANFELGNGDSNTISVPIGATITITEETKGYTLSASVETPTGLTFTELPDHNGIRFIMPDGEVTIHINNDKSVIVDTGVMLDTLPYALILAAVAVGGTALIKRRRYED